MSASRAQALTIKAIKKTLGHNPQGLFLIHAIFFALSGATLKHKT
jgi:cytochrome b